MLLVLFPFPHFIYLFFPELCLQVSLAQLKCIHSHSSLFQESCLSGYNVLQDYEALHLGSGTFYLAYIDVEHRGEKQSCTLLGKTLKSKSWTLTDVLFSITLFLIEKDSPKAGSVLLLCLRSVDTFNTSPKISVRLPEGLHIYWKRVKQW